ncbi:MAG: copper homeostasis protein CutC [Fimbriimonas sp.]
MRIEVCCGSVEEAIAAEAAGADRVELCAGLPTGGVTPSVGMIEEARAVLRIPIVAMVRPREGRANPPMSDFRASVRDVRHCFSAGADEVIVGVLDAAGEIDMDLNREYLAAAEGLPVAFHRVFDMTPDLDRSLESLVELGFARVLTSGGAADVDLGMARLGSLVVRAAGRITILPGGGVRPHNVRALAEIGCTEVHFSSRRASRFSGYGGVEDFEPDADRVRLVRELVG